jgi:hypothetical protein
VSPWFSMPPRMPTDTTRSIVGNVWKCRAIRVLGSAIIEAEKEKPRASDGKRGGNLAEREKYELSRFSFWNQRWLITDRTGCLQACRQIHPLFVDGNRGFTSGSRSYQVAITCRTSVFIAFQIKGDKKGPPLRRAAGKGRLSATQETLRQRCQGVATGATAGGAGAAGAGAEPIGTVYTGGKTTVPASSMPLIEIAPSVPSVAPYCAVSASICLT